MLTLILLILLNIKIPGGEFHIERCSALLNLYLAAIYGEGQWVEAHFEQQIYLNHKLIEQKQLNISEILNRAAEFLGTVQRSERCVFFTTFAIGSVDSYH